MKAITPKQVTEQMLTGEQVADMLAVCKKTVYRLRDSGRLPAVSITGSHKGLRFRLSDVEAVISGNK